MRELMTSLCHDVDYQYRLRADFRRRRVHPAIESLVWAHTVGKPAERVQLSADVTMSQKLDQERELFRKLSLDQLEQLAAESQALVDKAMAMVKANASPMLIGVSPVPVAGVDVATGEPAEQSPAPTVSDVDDDLDRI